MKLTGILALGITLGAAAFAHAAGVTKDEILIGTHLDLSGPVAAGMPQLRNGMQLRFDEANESGGIHGRKIKLIVEDNGSQPQMAVRATEKLIRQDKVFALVEPFGSGTNAAAIKRAVDSGTIYFAPWGASDAFQAIAQGNKHLFTIQPNYDTTTTPALVWAIEQLGAKKIGFIYMEGAFGESARKGVKAALDAKGLQLVAEAGYKPGDIDFSSQVARMRQAGADLVYITTVIRETVGIMAEVKKVGWTDAKIMTTFAGRTQLVLTLGKDAMEGLYGVAGWKVFNPADPPAELKAWSDKFRTRFNLVPDENAAVAYANADWFVKGLEAAGKDLTTEKAVKALQALTYDGTIYFSPKSFVNNQAEPQTVRIEQVQGGKWVPVSAPLGQK
jgi:ABC-type branched-subunit amino acid transport system substrate-binding protein